MPNSQITHSDIASYAERKVNLHRDDATKYREQVNRLRGILEKHIKEHPDVGLVKMLLSGSLAKGTALKTINDIDVAVYVDAGTAPSAESELIQWLTKQLRKAYHQMDPSQISPGVHSVRVTFRDSGLDVDVVPVYYSGDADDKGYLYSRDTGKRVLTSIPMHIQFMRKRGAVQPTHYKQVIRLLKWWARNKKRENTNFRCKSFFLELSAAHLIDNTPTIAWANYPAALADCFSWIVKSQLKDQVAFTDYYSRSTIPKRGGSPMQFIDPVNAENNIVEDYKDQDRILLVEYAEEASDAIAEAQYATTKSRAIECWQEVFGATFSG
jgi:predicted nucleotidyltransferase